MSEQTQIDKAVALVEEAKKAGADTADAIILRSQSVSVSVRLGKVEGTESSESDDFSLRVFIGKKLATISANLTADPKLLAQRAVAMAKVSPENPYEGLADQARLVKNPKNLDMFDDFVPDTQRLTEDALFSEAAALNVQGVSNSGGATAGYGVGGLVLVTSHGFCGSYQSSRFSRSVSAVAGEGTAMERDYDYTTAMHFADLESSDIVGKNAGERAVRRLNARRIDTGLVDVVFDPRMARGLAGHLASMVNGAAVARQTSLLQSRMNTQIMKPNVYVSDNPLKIRGIGSRPFDGEGVEGQALNIIEAGVLKHWFLSTSIARELKLETNGHGVRSSSSIVPSSSNFAIEPGAISPDEIIKNMKTGFYVTELVGHGVDLVTGQYSRGASGFWIENGELAFPVSEVTLGSNLIHMFANLIPANDIDRRYATAAPTVLIEGMTLAGK